jgi:hypothetical protein
VIRSFSRLADEMLVILKVHQLELVAPEEDEEG